MTQFFSHNDYQHFIVKCHYQYLLIWMERCGIIEVFKLSTMKNYLEDFALKFARPQPDISCVANAIKQNRFAFSRPRHKIVILT